MNIYIYCTILLPLFKLISDSFLTAKRQENTKINELFECRILYKFLKSKIEVLEQLKALNKSHVTLLRLN